MMELDASAFAKWLGDAGKKLEKQTTLALHRTAEAAATYARVQDWYENHTYRLRASIKPSSSRMTSEVTANAPYAAYVEHGTRPHTIEARRKTVLRFVINGEVFYRRKVRHQGTGPRPFMKHAQERATPLFSRLVTEAATNAFT